MSYITEQNQPPGWYPESAGETSGDVTIRPLSVVENGTYTAPSGTAYSPVDVNVEAGLTAEALSVVANGTYTAPSGKAYTPVVVNVPTGITPSGTKQISIAQNGTTTEDVTQYANAEITVDVQGGASGLSLLASGSFTLASQGATVSIPVSFSGNPINVFVIYRGGGTGIAHTHAWAFMASYPLSELDTLFPASADRGVRLAACVTDGGITNTLIPIRARLEQNNTIIDVRQTGSAYPCLAGQYDWYIYGEAAS